MFFKKIIIFLIYSPLIFALESVSITNGHWPPFMIRNDNENGLMTKICNEAFKSQNVKVNYHWFSWSKGIKETEIGHYDAALGWINNSERNKIFIFSKPFFKLDIVFFHRKDFKFDWNNFEDLKKYRIGLVKDYSYGDQLDNAVKNKAIMAEYSKDEQTVLRKLLSKRIDIFPIEKEVAESALKAHFTLGEIEQFTYNKKPFYSKKFGLLISRNIPNSEEIFKVFNQGLKTLIEQGKIMDLHDDY